MQNCGKRTHFPNGLKKVKKTELEKEVIAKIKTCDKGWFTAMFYLILPIRI
jgi:hypothetical protein